MSRYKAKSDSYLMKMTKAEIIEELREAECELSSLEEEFERGIEYARKSCDKLEEENAELKRMLKLAVEDIDEAMNGDTCEICSDKRCDKSTPCVWRYLDEAMKLIGGNENQIDKQEK